MRWALATDVRRALAAGKPVVALESSVWVQGLPALQSMVTAAACLEAVRAEGALAAVIGVVEGVICVGMTVDELRALCARRAVHKVSTRDLGAVCAAGGHGATTVAATVAVADALGIRVVATGGIGGVHREYPDVPDISADLDEIAKRQVVVVASGAKSVLNIPATLEVLETLGVPVLGYRTGDFPAFYCRTSGLPVPHRVDDPAAAAAAVKAHWALSGTGGVLVANPVPAAHALPPIRVEQAIHAALAAARREKIRGKAITPYLLAAIHRSTAGATVEANRALLVDNARVGARIAAALA